MVASCIYSVFVPFILQILVFEIGGSRANCLILVRFVCCLEHVRNHRRFGVLEKDVRDDTHLL